MPQPIPKLALSGLIAIICVSVALSVAALVRTGEWSWFGDVGRPLGLTFLTLLVARDIRWARWALVAWLSYSSIVFLVNIVPAIGKPFLQLLFLGMAGLYVWVVLEIVKVDIAQRGSHSA